MGHNEDGGLYSVNATFLIHAQILSTDGLMPLENFTAFCYAGELCGKAFGFNPTRKLVYSVNAVFPKNINPDAVGVCVRVGTCIVQKHSKGSRSRSCTVMIDRSQLPGNHIVSPKDYASGVVTITLINMLTQGSVGL